MVNPFSIIPYKTYYYVEYHKINFIETYLVNLNNIDKIKLNEYGVELQLLPNTLFNYYSLIKHLYTRITGDCIKKWSLIKIFIEIEAILHTFDVTRHHNYFDIISELVLQSSSFIYNIKNLSLDLYDSSYGATINDINPLLKFLSSNCNSISSFYFPIFAKHRYSMTINHISQLIKSQNDLKKIFFFSYEFPYSILLNSNCLNTLNTIIFYFVDFKNISVLYEVFEQLNVLESIHIIYCHSLDSNFIQQIFNLTKPFKLKSLFLNEMLESIELLLQKSGDYLENFGFQSFNIYKVNESESQLLELIISSIILQNLGQMLSFKLEYLDLSLIMNTNDLEILLKNSQNTFIKKLLFKLLSLKDEVKEFRLHDIIVQNYIDLKIKSFDFLKEIMFCY
ncbi:hypothetical protein RclHR1_15700004 [Rhizophagus clarus]|uniref:F-box domain-containing protein n=1 Tax=Rhizophagus clarus TaxID=94130 RepID=A0A2Z6QFY7_9GLOM|nr:hypothetical protein RclHR1_15700004 [Rhizophagus clarus]